MDSLHAYRIANTLASIAKDSHQHQLLFQRLAANTWLLASMNTAMFKTDLMHTAICFRSHHKTSPSVNTCSFNIVA